MNTTKTKHSSVRAKQVGYTDYATPQDQEVDYASNDACVDRRPRDSGLQDKLIFHEDMFRPGHGRDNSPGQRSNEYKV